MAKRKIDERESTPEKSQHETFMPKKSERKVETEGRKNIFRRACANCFIVMYTSAFARNMPNPLKAKFSTIIVSFRTRGSEKVLRSLYIFNVCLMMEYSWEPCSMLFDGMRRSSQSGVQFGWVVFQSCQLSRSVEGEHILFQPSEYRFSSVFLLLVRISWVPFKIFVKLCVHFTNSSEREGKENSNLSAKRGREEKRCASNSQRFSKLLFCVLHFPFLPFSRLRTFHWLGTNQRYLLLKSSSFILSLFPQIFSSCKNNHVHNVNQLRDGLRAVLV